MATSNPKRGEVWLVDLDPTRGQEIKRKRPVVVLSADPIGSFIEWEPSVRMRSNRSPRQLRCVLIFDNPQDRRLLLPQSFLREICNTVGYAFSAYSILSSSV